MEANWIKKLAEEYASELEPEQDTHVTHLTVTLAAPSVDIGKFYKLISSNGFPVLDISVTEPVEAVLPCVAAGERVETTASCVVGTNIMIKTPTRLYMVDSAVLPSGCIGEVANTLKTSAVVVFDANICVDAVDSSGYTDKVDYYVETAEIPLKNLKTL